MAGGGSQSTTDSKSPWGPAQPYLTDALAGLQSAFSKPPSYYPGNLTVGPTQAENSAWQKTNDYNSSVFGGAPALNFGQAVGAYNGMLGGGPQAGYASSLAPGAISGLNDLSNSGPYNLGQVGTAGSLDATSAINKALTGTPDYAGLQGSIDAANAPILRDFNQNIIPGLNSRATFLNNGTGGIKSLGNVMPDIAQRMNENALTATEGERQRALAAQQSAAGLVTNAGLQQNQLGLSAQQADASNKLNLGSLLGQYSNSASNNTGNALAQFGNMLSLGATPANTAQAYAAYDRSLKENALTADQTKFNYMRDQPMTQAAQLAQLLGSLGQQGGTSTANSNYSTGGGASDWISGALGLASLFGGGGGGSTGGLINGIKGLFGGGAAPALQAAGASAAGDAGAGTLGSLGNFGGAGLGGGSLGTGAGSAAGSGSSLGGFTGIGGSAGAGTGVGAGAGAGAVGAGAGALQAAGASAVGDAGAGTLAGLGNFGGAGLGGTGSLGSGILSTGGADAAGAGAAGSGAGAGASSGAFAPGGFGTAAGSALGIGTIAAAGANMVGAMTGRGDAASWNGPLPAGVTKTTTAGGQGAVQAGNMVFGLGSMGKQGGSMNWFTKGADGKQKWVGADANQVITQYATTGNIAPPGQGQKNAKGFNAEPGTREAMNASDYTQAKMKGYYDKLGGQVGLGTNFNGWLQQLRSVGQGLRFYDGGQGNIF